MTPEVTVVIPSYNYGHYIAGAIASVLDQSERDFELLIIDDESRDDTETAVKPFLNDARVQFHSIQHAGVAVAKNTGIRLGRAPFIAFLDADDHWLPTKLEKQLRLFAADADLGVAYSRRLLINETGVLLNYEQPTLHRGHILPEIFHTNFVCQSSAMVRREVFEDVGFFDERCPPCEDYDLWLRVARWFRFDYVDEPLVEYRVGHASLSSRYADRLLLALEIMDRFLDEHDGRRLIPAKIIREARAETYFHLSLAKRDVARLAALRFNVKGLMASPSYLPAWKGLASLPVPERGRRVLRRLLGKAPTWERQAIEAGTQ